MRRFHVLLPVVLCLAGWGKSFGQNVPPISQVTPTSQVVPEPAPAVLTRDDFLIVSIAVFNATTWDVKLQNPRTGYVHSLTLHFGVEKLRLGEWVRQNPDGTLTELSHPVSGH